MSRSPPLCPSPAAGALPPWSGGGSDVGFKPPFAQTHVRTNETKTASRRNNGAEFKSSLPGENKQRGVCVCGNLPPPHTPPPSTARVLLQRLDGFNADKAPAHIRSAAGYKPPFLDPAANAALAFARSRNVKKNGNFTFSQRPRRRQGLSVTIFFGVVNRLKRRGVSSR